MGCAQSKIENEEAVTRCKERKQFMKDAVTARNAFAAAHSAYAMALKNTGAALSDYSHGEFLVSSGGASHSSAASAIASSSSVPVALSPPSPTSVSAAISNSSAVASSSSSVTGAIPQPIPDTLPPPPPPPPPPLQRAATMPEMNGRSGVHSGNGLNGTIIEEDGTLDSDSDSESENHDRLVRKSRSSRGGGGSSNREHHEETTAPPPPPANSRPIQPPRQLQHQHQQEQPFFDYFFDVDHTPGTTLEDNPHPHLSQVPKQQSQPPQVAKPESLPHSEEEDDTEEDDTEEEEEEETVVKRKQPVEEKPKRAVEEMENVTNLRGMKKSTTKGIALAGGGRLPATTKANLSNVFNELDDNFLKASESAHEVSKMLEATRLHYHSNFADNRGQILIR